MQDPSAELLIYLAVTRLGMTPNEVLETDTALLQTMLAQHAAYSDAENKRQQREQQKQKQR